MRAKALLSYDEVSEVFELIDGELWRKEYTRKNGIKYNRKLVKNVPNDSDGYCTVTLSGRSVKYQRLVWVLYHKKDLSDTYVIDHINGDVIDNRPENLRAVTVRENSQNRKKHRLGRLPGCCYHKATGKWVAYTQYRGVRYHIGLYGTEQDAHDAYVKVLRGLSDASMGD